MNNELIKNWNLVVGKNDIIYVLGDFIWGNNTKEIIKSLNGNINIIPGNHDNIKKYKGITICRDIHVITYANQKICLCHYRMFTWPGKNHNIKGSWHLYGHSHGALTEEPVAADSWNYKPVSFEQLQKMFRSLGMINEKYDN